MDETCDVRNSPSTTTITGYFRSGELVVYVAGTATMILRVSPRILDLISKLSAPALCEVAGA